MIMNIHEAASRIAALQSAASIEAEKVRVLQVQVADLWEAVAAFAGKEAEDVK